MNRIFIAAAIFIVLAILACHKDSGSKPASASLTTGMKGVRNWKGHHHYEASGPHFIPSIYEDWDYPDTSFALTIVNDSTVGYMGKEYRFESFDSINSRYFFGGAKYYYIYGASTGVAYYYQTDSIVYCSGDRHATTDTWTINNYYHTYK